MPNTSGEETDLTNTFMICMRQLASTVTIVTTSANGRSHGMTATAVTSVSKQPPALLVCVNRAASIHGVLALGQPFCVNILAEGHAHLSMAFGGGLKPDMRFTQGSWGSNEDGIPRLNDALALVLCKVDRLMDYGTHSVIVGQVTSASATPGRTPLIYGHGRFLSVAL